MSVTIEAHCTQNTQDARQLSTGLSLRTSLCDGEAAHLWRAYACLTAVESVFRARTSERGLRPIFHYKECRADGHLLISVLADQAVHVLRTQMTEAGGHDSGSTLRDILADLHRTPTTFRRKDGQIAPVRKTATPDVRCRPTSPKPYTHRPTAAQRSHHRGLKTRHPPASCRDCPAARPTRRATTKIRPFMD